MVTLFGSTWLPVPFVPSTGLSPWCQWALYKGPPLSDSKGAIISFLEILLRFGPFWSRVLYLVIGFGPGGRFGPFWIIFASS